MLTPSEWQGRTGDAWAEEWRRTDRTLAPVNAALLACAAPLEDARILDIGCGAGATSFAFADAFPNAAITGLDLSDALVAAARARIGGHLNVRFVSGDASRWAPEDGRPFDLIVSRHGVMFFDDPIAAFARLRSLAPAGRLLFSCFRAADENEWVTAMRPAIARHAPAALDVPPPASGPFAFADPARIDAILRSAGFAPPVVTPLDFDFLVGAGADPLAEALAYFRRIGPLARLMAGLDDATRAAFLADIAGIAAARMSEEGVVFRAAAWIVDSKAGAS
jgi:SAM-dependent methyltransferase